VGVQLYPHLKPGYVHKIDDSYPILFEVLGIGVCFLAQATVDLRVTLQYKHLDMSHWSSISSPETVSNSKRTYLQVSVSNGGKMYNLFM